MPADFTPLVWITGLPGSGKTTLASQLANSIRAVGAKCILLDGDDLREILQKEDRMVDYSTANRLNLALLYSKLAISLNAQNITTIVSTVSLFWRVQQQNRALSKSYFEVFLDVDKSFLENGPRRDLYNSNFSSEFVPEFPQTPDLVLSAKNDSDRETWLATLKANLAGMYE